MSRDRGDRGTSGHIKGAKEVGEFALEHKPIGSPDVHSAIDPCGGMFFGLTIRISHWMLCISHRLLLPLGLPERLINLTPKQ